MGYDIFISYRRDDEASDVKGGEALARHLKVRLQQDWHFKVFLDQRELLAGEDWSEKIQAALDSAHTVVVVFCKNCLRVTRENDVFLHEIRSALERKVKVIPVFLKGFDRKDLPGELQFPSQGIPWNDLDGPYDELADQIGRSIGPNSLLMATLETQVRMEARSAVQDDGKCNLLDEEHKEIIRLVERFKLPPQFVQAVIVQEEDMHAREMAGGGSPELHAATPALPRDPRPAPPEVGADPNTERNSVAVASTKQPVPEAPPKSDANSAGPTRFARKYIKDMEPALEKICLELISGLPGSVDYHYERDSDCIWFHCSDTIDFQAVIRGRPRLHRLDIVFNAEADDALSDGTTYLQRLTASGAPNVDRKYPGWSGDARISCSLEVGCPADAIGVVKRYLEWFLLEAPRMENGTGSSEAEPARSSSESKTTAGPTRHARKFIESQPEGFQKIIWSVIEGLPDGIEYHRQGDDFVYFHPTSPDDYTIYIRCRPRKRQVEFIFYAVDGERLFGTTSGKTYFSELQAMGCPNPRASYKDQCELDFSGSISCALADGASAEEIDAVRRYVRWYLLEAPNAEAEE